MTSIRHNTPAEDSYLDAAMTCILDVGLRRTTITDIARRAGVARMTIYRSWPDMNALMGDLMAREWFTEVEKLRANVPASPLDKETIADIVVTTVRTIRNNALFQKIIDVDPEFLLPYLTIRRGRSHDYLIDLFVSILNESQKAQKIRPGNVELIVRTVMLAAAGFMVSMRTMTDDFPTAKFEEELRHMIVGYL